MNDPRVLLLFGDSLLAKFDKPRIEALELLLPGWQVINCATGGFNVRDALARIGPVARIQPDAVLLSLGLNDLAPWKDQVPPGEFGEGLAELFAAFGTARPAMLLPPRTIEERQPIDRLRSNTDVEAYRSVARHACERCDVEMIDGEAVAEAVREDGLDSHDEDGVHLAPAMYDVLVEQVAQLLAGVPVA